MALGEHGLDRRLADREPVERRVELLFVDDPEAELVPQAGGGGLGRQRAGRGKLGGRIEDAADGERQDEVAAAVAVWPDRRSRPILRAVPSAAATCPCGRERMMLIASFSLGMTVPPLSSALKPAIRSLGQSDRLSNVRFLTFPPSR